MGTSTEAIVYYGYPFKYNSKYSDQLSDIFNEQSSKAEIQVDLSGYMDSEYGRYFIYGFKNSVYFSSPDQRLTLPNIKDLRLFLDDKLATFLKEHNIVRKNKPYLYLTGNHG